MLILKLQKGKGNQCEWSLQKLQVSDGMIRQIGVCSLKQNISIAYTPIQILCVKRTWKMMCSVWKTKVSEESYQSLALKKI